jgi:hypothetical protein
MKTSSRAADFSGLYQRGKHFWFRYRHNGHQYRVPLKTDDAGEALVRAMAIRSNPILAGANTFRREIEAYVRRQRESRTFTQNSAENWKAVLLSAAGDLSEYVRSTGGSKNSCGH